MDILTTDLWWVKRFVEASTGAILGAVLWFIIGLAEKFLILKHRTVKDAEP